VDHGESDGRLLARCAVVLMLARRRQFAVYDAGDLELARRDWRRLRSKTAARRFVRG